MQIAITGTTTGIGRACVELLQKENYKMVYKIGPTGHHQITSIKKAHLAFSPRSDSSNFKIIFSIIQEIFSQSLSKVRFVEFCFTYPLLPPK